MANIDPFEEIAPLANSTIADSSGSLVEISDEMRENYVNDTSEEYGETRDGDDEEWGFESDFERNVFEDVLIDDE